MNSKIESLTDQIEFHAHMLSVLGKQAGYNKITDKTKWREPVMAGKLGHQAFQKISAGKNSDKYGADAFDPSTGKMAEYKTQAIEDSQLKNLLGKVKNVKKNTKYSALNIVGVYNGAYTHEAVDAYMKHDHYFGLFYDEKCILIVKPNKEYLIQTLRDGVDAILAKNAGTTNLNSVKISLKDTHLYETVYKDEDWFLKNV